MIFLVKVQMQSIEFATRPFSRRCGRAYARKKILYFSYIKIYLRQSLRGFERQTNPSAKHLIFL